MKEFNKLIKKYQIEFTECGEKLTPPFTPELYSTEGACFAFTVEAIWTLFKEVDKLKK